MEEETTPAPVPQTSSRFKIITGLAIVIALALVGAGAYYTGSRYPSPASPSPAPASEVLGTESTATPVPTEIPSLADTPVATPSSTSTPIPVNPTLKIFSPPKNLQLLPSATPTPTPVPTIKFQKYQAPLQIQP
jgi:hypothetical protein